MVATFPIVNGWIDSGKGSASTPPDYALNAFGIMTSIISQKAEALGLHGFVYARQYWSEVCSAFPEPNAIILCLLNPFNTSLTDTLGGKLFDQSDEAARLKNLQSLIDQLEVTEFWMENLRSSLSRSGYSHYARRLHEFFSTRSEISIRPSVQA